MKVLFFDQQSDLVVLSESVAPIVKHVLKIEGRSTDEVAIYFVSTEEICRLHQDFFADPSPTDCISFPLDDQQTTGYHILGEVFVCPKTAMDYVLTSSEEFTEDIYTETTLYLIHGLLHLLGYDDIEDADRQNMRDAEQRVMRSLIEKNLLLK